MKNKILITLFFIFLLLFVIPYNSGAVLGSQQDRVEDFEDDTLTQQATDNFYGSLWFNTWNDTYQNTFVDNTQAQSGTKSYRVYRNERGFFNFTYSENQLITRLRMRLWFTDFTATRYRYIEFYNESDIIFMKIRITDVTGTYKLVWEDFNGQQFLTDISDAWDLEWLYLNMTIIANDTMYMNLTRPTGGYRNNSGVSTAPLQVIDFPRIAYIRIRSTASHSSMDTWIDDIEILQFANELGSGEDETIPSCLPDDTIGQITNTGNSITVNLFPFVWYVYSVRENMYIHRLDLEIDEYMIDKGVQLGDITAKINEVSIGSPTELVQLGTDDDYRISWTGLNVFINDTFTTITFRNTQGFDASSFWVLPFTNNDINNDGINYFVSYGKESWWNNHGSHIDESPEGMNQQFRQIFLNRELSVRMCVERTGTLEFNTNIQNYVESYPNVVNALCSQINIDWFLNSTAMANINRLWIDSNFSVGYIARNITTQTGHMFYTPTQIGTYWFNLSSNGVNVTSDITTVSGTCDNWIYTVPNPSGGGVFAIFYNYSSQLNGALRFYDKDNVYLGKINIAPETANGYTTYSYNEHEILHIYLTSVTTIGAETVYNNLYSYVHCVQGLVVNQIDIGTQTNRIPVNTPFNIFGYHSHLSKNVNVYVGNSIIGSVGESEYFSLIYSGTKSGSYLIRLQRETPDGRKIILDSLTINIYDPRDFEPPPLIPSLNPIISYLLGAIVVLIFLFMPQLLQAFLNQKMDIPKITPFFTAGVGVVIAVGMGLWDMWALFFIIFIGVIIVLIMYVVGSRRGI